MENRKINSIMNKNWETMHGILDKEMPVQKKRKRALWLWMFIFGGFATSAGIFIAQNNSINKSDLKKIDEVPLKKPLVQNKGIASIESVTYEHKILSTNAITKNENKILENNNSTKKRLNQSSQNEPTNTVESNSQGFNDENLVNNTIKVPQVQIEATSEAKSILLPTEIHFETLDSKDIAALEFRHSLPGLSVMNVSNNRLYKLGLLTSMATTNYESLSSFFVGIQGERKLNKSLVVYSNLGWRQYKGSNTNIQNDYNNFNNFHSELTNSHSSDPNADAQLNQLIIRDITKTVSYIELSGGLKYQLFNRLAIQSSMNLGYLAKETYQIDEETRVNYQDLGKSYNIDNIISNVGETDLHQKWVAHINLGLEARLYRSLYLFSNMHQLLSINNQSESLVNNLDTDNNWLELGIKYNFID